MPKKSLWWVKFAPEKWLADASANLTNAQEGVYIRLVATYYNKRQAIRPDRMAAIARVSQEEWERDYWPALSDYFEMKADGLYHHAKCDEVLDEREIVSEKRRSAGSEGAKVRWPADRVANATQMGWQNDRQIESELEEERVPPSEGGEPPSKMTQASLLPEPEQAPSVEKMLWSEGLAIFARLSKKPAGNCRGQLGDLAKIAGPEVLLEVLRNHRDKPAKDSGYAWVKSCCEVRKNQSPRLVVDNDPNDAWGIDAWCRSLPGVVPTSSDTERAIGKWVIHGRVIDAFAKRIAKAAMLSGSWRGDWSALEGWARDKIKIDDVVAAVQAKAEWGDYDPKAISSIRFFDASVRGGRKAA